MKYNKELFINNIKHLTSYDYEPEITIKLNNGSTAFIIAYKDFIDITIDNNETIKLEKIEDLFYYIDFDSIVEIEGDIDFEFPIEVQSIVHNGDLWIDADSPKQVINRFKKELLIFRIILVTVVMISLACLLIIITRNESFDLEDIIVCSTFGGITVLCMIFFTIYDIRRNKLLKKYYGIVSEEDKNIAKKLLDKIKVVDKNEYDFFDLFHYDTNDLMVKQALELIIKGKKVYIGIYDPIKIIEQELINNNADNKYNDIEFNEYILELVKLLERNLCDI